MKMTISEYLQKVDDAEKRNIHKIVDDYGREWTKKGKHYFKINRSRPWSEIGNCEICNKEGGEMFMRTTYSRGADGDAHHDDIKFGHKSCLQRGQAPAWLMRAPVPSPGNKSNGGRDE